MKEVCDICEKPSDKFTQCVDDKCCPSCTTKFAEGELRKLRSRWKRWLGQKTRRDKFYYVTLLNCNWSGWASKVLNKTIFTIKDPTIYSSREDIKHFFKLAIDCADMKDLLILDNLYASELINKEK